ncbi:hypothetical protein [Ensifer sp. SL37]|uniref:hypothetical protein n=1 Tax=Ensifer sp. SL37 TaxID=2995137 RepID=UPI0022727D47|nr:hypothetical protein [Ensifer sp. SL37]MCY1741188.1 hypothetical protein [Ensifer sp. SL37]
MREFSKVSPQLWGKKGFKTLSDGGKLAMLYFLTCRHQTSAGCYHLPDGYASADLGWTIEEYKTARKELEDASFIVFDEEVSEIYIRGWFADNPITNDKHFMGCERLVGMLESEMIQDVADKEMHESNEKRSSKGKSRSRIGDGKFEDEDYR